MDLSNFFSAAEARMDWWSQPNIPRGAGVEGGRNECRMKRRY